jgi:CHAD domain-containing protein
MSFVLDLHEPLPVGVRRVLVEELDAALADLRPGDDWDEAVHDARKRMKKVRGVARLVRPALSDDDYVALNAGCRDAATLLSAARDAEVLLATFDDLVGEDFTAAHDALVRHRSTARRRSTPASPSVARATATIRRVRTGVVDGELAGIDTGAVEAGLARVYRRGRREMAAAYREETAEAFHQWRKRAKYLWYGLRLLATGWPEAVEPLVAVADELSDVLGREHDLTVLTAATTGLEAPSLHLAPTERERFDRLCTERRARLRAQARELGDRVYAERPRSFAGRIVGYWASAQSVRDSAST